MRKLILTGFLLSAAVPALACPQSLTNGFYFGVGGSFATYDESFRSNITSSNARGAVDYYQANRFRLAPLAEIGYWAPICGEWLWGASAQWKYLGHYTPNENSSRGQHIPNATFSSINFFGPEVLRDFSSETEFNNELQGLLYFGFRVCKGFTYLGIGPALISAKNSIYVSSVHTPNGVGDTLISTSVNKERMLLGGVAEVGYNYYVSPKCFLNISYSYSRTSRNSFDNNVNAAVLNGFDLPGPVTLEVNRSISLVAQQIMLSINRVF